MHDDKLTRSKAALMTHKPYFGMMSSHLDIVMDEDYESFATKENTLYINPDYLDTLSLEETQFVLSNAAMHRLLGHAQRSSQKMEWLWELASDYAINAVLHSNEMPLPDRVHYDARFDGKYAEEIYEILRSEISDETLIEQEQKYQAQKEEAVLSEGLIESEHKIALEKADKAGDLPKDIERLITQKVASKISWREALTGFIQEELFGDFTRFPPNKKFLHQGIYLPSYAPNPKKLAVVVDSSASISQALLDQFVAEIEAIRLDSEAVEIELFVVDTKVQHYERFVYGEPFFVTIKGGGGTKLEPAFEMIEAEGIDVGAMIYFTDGQASFGMIEPYYPVMWVLPKAVSLPFGRMTLLDD